MELAEEQARVDKHDDHKLKLNGKEDFVVFFNHVWKKGKEEDDQCKECGDPLFPDDGAYERCKDDKLENIRDIPLDTVDSALYLPCHFLTEDADAYKGDVVKGCARHRIANYYRSHPQK